MARKSCLPYETLDFSAGVRQSSSSVHILDLAQIQTSNVKQGEEEVLIRVVTKLTLPCNRALHDTQSESRNVLAVMYCQLV